jgi:hypothetical protein
MSDLEETRPAVDTPPTQPAQDDALRALDSLYAGFMEDCDPVYRHEYEADFKTIREALGGEK